MERRQIFLKLFVGLEIRGGKILQAIATIIGFMALGLRIAWDHGLRHGLRNSQGLLSEGTNWAVSRIYAAQAAATFMNLVVQFTVSEAMRFYSGACRI